MAIVQISRIQIRRGLQQDLPQLASAEMGWSLDTQRLFIGNGLPSEGAPATGVTEILTNHSNILSLIGLYTYAGSSAGYTVITGPDSGHPVTRSLQSKIDDNVSVRDFGAVGDGITDDTAAINRAMQQIYSSLYNDTLAADRRTIYFPAAKYLISGTILIPPYARLVGDGRFSSVLTTVNGTVPMIRTVDSQFNGTGATLPRDVIIENIGLQNTALPSAITSSLLTVDSVKNGKFVNMSFVGNIGSPSNLVYITDSVSSTRNIVFDHCTFEQGGAGINVIVQGTGISSIRVIDGFFNNLSNVGYFISNTVNGFSEVGSYYNSVGVASIVGNNGTRVGLGASSQTGNVATGLFLGRENIGITNTILIPTGNATVIANLSVGAGSFDYQLDDGANFRFGVFKYTNTGSITTFEDEYVETGIGSVLSANLFANATGNLSCSVASTATFKYNLKQYY